MLNFTIKLISDAGFQGEITSISTAAQQIEVFSRILKNSIVTFLQSDEDNLNRNMSECAKMVCHGQHTYVYAQVLLSVLAYENKGKLWFWPSHININFRYTLKLGSRDSKFKNKFNNALFT